MDDDGPQSIEPPSPGDTNTLLHIEIVDEQRLLGRDACAWIESTARAALGGVVPQGGSVRGRVVDDTEMAEAHMRWMDVPGTTDVLTFDMREFEDEPLDVDMLLCADEAGRQAEARGLRPEHEVLLYIVHGVLHCLGYDDHDEAEAARMHAEEDRLLVAAGVGAIYAAADRAVDEHTKEPTR